MARLADRISRLKDSSTLAVTAKAKALKAAGADVISFGAGEPDFATPAHIVEAACKALREGKTRYENTAGTPEARKAVAQYFQDRFQRQIGPENVIISTGAKQALYLAFLTLMNPGQELLLPAPYWVTYPAQATMAGGKIKVIETDVANDFKVTPELLEAAITPESRLFLFCSPSNPAGISYTAQETKALAEVIARHPQLYVISDEIYERLRYTDEPYLSFAQAHPEIADRVVTINGLSKAYAMTGWRIGYAVAAPDIIKAMTKLQGHMSSSITSFNMPAVVAALEGPQEPVEKMVAEFAKRAEYIYKRLTAIPNLRCPRPTGAFYAFPDVSAYFGLVDPQGQAIDSAASLASGLLEAEKVAIVAGEDFGTPNHVRLSFATSMELIERGLDRFSNYLASLR